MKIREKFPGRILPFFSALLISSLLLAACGSGGSSGSGSGGDGDAPSDTARPSSPTILIDGGAARTGSSRVNLSLSASDDVGVTHYFVSENGTLPDNPAWMALAEATTDYAESYLDATFDADSIGDKTFYAWFRDAAGGVSDRTSDSIARYETAGRARDAGMTACFNTSAQIDCTADASTDFFGQDAQYDGLLSTYTVGEGLRAGTVRDNVTGLVWRRVLDSAAARTRSFEQLTALCEALDLGGYDDWRVPTVREALSLILFGKVPFSSEFTIPNPNGTYIWSQTPLATSRERNWVVSANTAVADGSTDAGQDTTNICVRGVSRLPFDYDFTARGTGTPDTSDDTVVESRTGLVWDRRETERINWQSALAYCADSTHDGRTDWRLPSADEGFTLIDYDATTGARTDSAFDNALGAIYWTSTTPYGEGRAGSALSLNFAGGFVDAVSKLNNYHVRCLTD